ncbi:DUF429 domain-containing protein [Methylomonas koyamae]|uniref:Uncharacterized protein n=1 Tax=Methylomonas koyamae TaxID=702114 RepID=A0A291IJW5_9GAMM|nr:DUF429 domain-containing protein [Methylomonas koyamae]ATG90633.1 hypothetical protein MKLM6_2412 [Methylomonas koyamae]OAI29768.1 hypothetical protein A1356_22970 [Methylomonas koyamae]
MKFVGIDLTSAFSASPRPIDVAVLDDQLNARFLAVAWPKAAAVIDRNPNFLTEMLQKEVPVKSSERMILAIDGPQGLAAVGNSMRACERILGTPGRTPSTLPPAEETGAPFQGYIRSSIDLFAGLAGASPNWQLSGLNGVGNFEAGLWEVFPGAEWGVLAKRRLPLKTTIAGRKARRDLFEALRVKFTTQALPTPDQNDALVGAYLAWCVHNRASSIEFVGVAPEVTNGEFREGFILHAGSPLGVNLSATESAVALSAGALEMPPEVARDWNDDQALLLMLTDYGLVHGTERENAWLIPGRNYTLETTSPHDSLRIQLVHAATFSGGQGWRVYPTTRNILAQLGYPAPQHLKRENAVTLRVVMV